jgi:hypothetical protein
LLLPIASTTWFSGDCIYNAVVAGAGVHIVWMPLVLHANAFLFFVSGCVECKHNFGENLHPAALFFSSPLVMFQIFCGGGSGVPDCLFVLLFTMVHIHQAIIDHTYRIEDISVLFHYIV